ncbi:MAG: YtxH domain-containing protein [Paludibacteraceae bacterium]|nr:YtxH domain-containing protein [Paludibacteraceae bacterium]MBR3520770.1 YtxH domain-containing protein [Paludibacteraceae bacterium]
MGNFVKGAVIGAAAVLLGNYLLNTEEGKETCKKIKDKVKKTADEWKDKLEKELNQFDGKDSTSTSVTKQVEDVMEE